MKNRRSPIWSIFTVTDAKLAIAQCDICKNSFSFKTSITNLKKHIRMKHPKIKMENIENNNIKTNIHIECSNSGVQEIENNLSSSASSSVELDTTKLTASASITMNMDRRISNLWDIFTIEDAEFSIAQCDICGKSFSYKSSVINLKKHIRSKHPTIHIENIQKNREKNKIKTNNQKQCSNSGVQEIEDNLSSSALSSEELDATKPTAATSITTMNMTRRKSHLWKIFTVLDDKLSIAQCDICRNSFSYKSSISNLKKHIHSKHPSINTENIEKNNIKTNIQNECSKSGVQNIEDNLSSSASPSEELDATKPTASTSITTMNTNRRKSLLWNIFTVSDAELSIAQCDICKNSISYKGSISNLKKHIHRKHPTIDMENIEKNNIKTNIQNQCSNSGVQEIENNNRNSAPQPLKRDTSQSGKKRPNPSNETNEFFDMCKTVLESQSKLDISEFDAVGVSIAKKLQRMNHTQAILAEGIINNVLTRGLLETLSNKTKLCDGSCMESFGSHPPSLLPVEIISENPHPDSKVTASSFYETFVNN